MTSERYIKRNYLAEKRAGSLGGVAALMRSNHYKNRKDVEHALRDLSTFALHRPIKKKFKRRFYLCPYIGYMCTADLVFYKSISRYNSGISYLLVVVECMSRFMSVIKLRTKTGAEVALGLEKIIKQSKFKCERLFSDAGTEFYSHEVKTLLKKYNIKLYSAYSPIHSGLIEAENRVLKSKISHYQRKMNTKRYVDVLDTLVNSINNTYHSGIKFIPADVKNTTKHADMLWHNLYDRFIKQKKEPVKYKVGDFVLVSSKRLRHNKNPFVKGYLERFEREVYKISEIIDIHPVPFIRLTTTGENPEPLEGMFYQSEITRYNKEKLDDE